MDKSAKLNLRWTNLIAVQQKIIAKISAQNNNLTNEYDSQTVFLATIKA